MDEPQPIRGIPRRREVAALYLLYTYKPRDLGEAIDLVSTRLCTTRRTARRILKRLRRIGLLRVEKHGGALLVEVASPEDLVRAIAIPYISRRGDEEGCTR
ncbi:MAG: hypothetical protein GSR86_06180 [Desulfurococcales archaeon]|nr:hypothetical protein [Desulfurococcales archaeon]